MKNFRSSLILALVVAGLFGFLLFGNKHLPSTAQREQAALFPSLDPEKAEFLRIADPEGAVEARKKGGLWSVTAPAATEADGQAVADVLRALAGLRALRVIPLSDIQKGGETLQSWQLVPGTVRAEFSGPGFSGLLRIGRKTAVSDLIYASASAAPDAPVVLLPASSRDDIDKKLADLRSRAALRFAPGDVAQCGLRGAAPAATATPGTAAAEFQLERAGGPKTQASASSWKLQKPLSAAADAGRVQKWLQALASLRVREFVSDDASDLTAYGLNTPVSQIWVQAAGAKAPETLLVGLPVPGAPAGAQGRVYAKRLSGNTVFTLASLDVERLVRGLPETRDRKVVPFAAGDAVAIKVETGLDGKGQPRLVAAKKDGDAWAYEGAAPVGAPDAARLGDFLQAVSTLEAAQIVSDTTSDLKPYGLDRPSARVTVTLKKGDGTDTETLLLGKIQATSAPAPAKDKDGKSLPPPAPLLFAKNAEQPFVYAVPAAFADGLPRDAWQWLDARVVPNGADGTDGAKITRLTFTPDAGTPFHITRDAQGSYQTDWTGATVVPAEASAQIATLAGLRAERWLGPVQAAFGLAKPRWKIAVETASGPAYAVLLGAEVPGGGHAAQIEGQPYAFVVAPADYALLSVQPFAPAVSAPPATSPR